MLLFLGFFGMIRCWIRWRQEQKRRFRQIGIAAEPHHPAVLDESKWNAWSSRDLKQWTLAQQEEDEEWSSSVCRAIQVERLDGHALQFLTCDDLRSMNVAYGHARRFLQTVERRLKRRYPHCLTSSVTTIPNDASLLDTTGNSTTNSVANDLTFSGWLGQHDQEYNNRVNKNSSMDHLSSFVPMQQSPQVTGGLESAATLTKAEDPHFVVDAEEMEERARQVMKERFSLELPKLESSVPSTQNRNEITTPLPPSSPTRQQRPPPNTDAAMDEERLKGIIPPELLESMPPHIRTIASRKPELVRQLLRGQLPQQTNSTKRQSQQNVDRQLAPLLETNNEDEQSYYYDDDEDVSSDDDGERTRLLRKRRNRDESRKYEAV